MIEIICQFIDWVIATLSASYFFHWCARGYRAIREQDVNSAVHKVESKEMITGALSLSLSLSRQRPSLNQLPSELVRLVILNLTIEEIIDFDKAISEKSPRDLWLSTLRSLRPHYWENSVGTIFSTRILQFIISREIFQTNEPIPVDIKLDSNRERPESNLNYAVHNNLYAVVKWLSKVTLPSSTTTENKNAAKTSAVDTFDRNGRTPLQHCALQGDKTGLKMTALLLSLGADPNKVNSTTKWTPLLLCLLGKDSKAIAKLLLKETAVNVTFKDAAGRTALSYAVEFGKYEIAYFLLDRMIKDNKMLEENSQNCPSPSLSPSQGLAESSDEDKGGLSPVHYSARSGDINLTRMLLSSAEESAVNAKDVSGRTPLHLAALHGHADITRLLASRSNDINGVDNRGRSALYLAIEAGFVNIATLLAVDYSADTLVVESR